MPETAWSQFYPSFDVPHFEVWNFGLESASAFAFARSLDANRIPRGANLCRRVVTLLLIARIDDGQKRAGIAGLGIRIGWELDSVVRTVRLLVEEAVPDKIEMS